MVICKLYFSIFMRKNGVACGFADWYTDVNVWSTVVCGFFICFFSNIFMYRIIYRTTI